MHRLVPRNELEELLELSCSEPAHGPRFYRCFLRSEIHALCPASDLRRNGAKIRFVMWTGSDGVQVIPCFSSRTLAASVLSPTIATYKIAGRQLLEATRGATIVLNPNEPFSCRLAPHEIAALLETGAVSRPRIETLKEDKPFATFQRGHSLQVERAAGVRKSDSRRPLRLINLATQPTKLRLHSSSNFFF